MEIYAIRIDKGNGEVGWYIGQTTRGINRRFAEHLCAKRGIISNAIRKYGRNNTEIITLVENVESIEELDRLETFYIGLFRSHVNFNAGGYNATMGGHVGKRTSPNIIESIKKLAIGDKTMVEIANILGISWKTVSRVIREYKLQYATITKQTPDMVEIVKQKTENGERSEYIASELNVHKSTVWRIQKKLGFASDKKSPRQLPGLDTPEIVDVIRTLSADGKTLDEISSATGIRKANVWSIRKRHNIPIPFERQAKKITSEDIELIRHLVDIGTTSVDIAKQLNVTRACVEINKRKNGIRVKDIDIIDKVRQLTNEGFTATEISIKLGVSSSTILRIKRKYSITGGEVKLTNKDIENITHLTYQGKTNKQISEELGISKSSIQRVKTKLKVDDDAMFKIRKELGVVKGNSTISSDMVNEIRRLYAEEKCSREIAKELGIKLGKVKYIKKRYGIISDER